MSENPFKKKQESQVDRDYEDCVKSAKTESEKDMCRARHNARYSVD